MLLKLFSYWPCFATEAVIVLFTYLSSLNNSCFSTNEKGMSADFVHSSFSLLVLKDSCRWSREKAGLDGEDFPRWWLLAFERTHSQRITGKLIMYSRILTFSLYTSKEGSQWFFLRLHQLLWVFISFFLSFWGNGIVWIFIYVYACMYIYTNTFFVIIPHPPGITFSDRDKLKRQKERGKGPIAAKLPPV